MATITAKEFIRLLQELPEDSEFEVTESYGVENVELESISTEANSYSSRPTVYNFDEALRGEKHIPAWQAVRRKTVTIITPWETYGDGKGNPLVEAPWFSEHGSGEWPETD